MPGIVSAKMIDTASLPALPQVLMDLIDACGRQDIAVSEVALIVSRDPALTTRVLQLANSALFGTRHPIADIGQAVVFLGLDILRNLAIAVSAHEIFRAGKGGGPWMATFWHHSILAASLCQKLAVKLGYGQPSQAYLAGLLDNIGMLFFHVQMPERYAGILAEIPQKDWQTALIAREIELFGATHAEIGSMVLRKWNLVELADVVASPSLGQLPAQADLLSLVTIARLRLAGLPLLAQSWLDAASLDELYREAEVSVEELARIMGIRVAPATVVAPPVVTPVDDDRCRLTNRMLTSARLEGLLASFLAASDLSGICRALEQGMAILLGVDHVVALLPDADKLHFRPSRDNPLHETLAGRFWPLDDHDSCVAHSLSEEMTCRIGQGEVSEAEREILGLFATTALLAVPLPLDMRRRGVVLMGIEEGQLPRVQTGQETILLFAAHAGARIRQEEIHDQQARMLARQELLVAENIARGILHEIVNPLATVQNAIRLLEEDTFTGQELAVTLGIISGEAERIGQVAGQLRRLAESVREAQLQKVDLNALVADTVALFRKIWPNRHFREIFDADLPPFTSSLDILRQALEILLDTASKTVAADSLVTVATGTYDDDQAMVEIRLSRRGEPDWHDDLLTVQLARRRLRALDGRVISREYGVSADGGSGWLFRLTVPMPLLGDETFSFEH